MMAMPVLRCSVKPRAFLLKNRDSQCYPGGGFGGRDRSEFPLFLALAAVMSPNVPVRIVQSRFDQFQGGLKRHPAKTELERAIDKKGIFRIWRSHGSCIVSVD